MAERTALFYCLGGGRGHVTRGIAIARKLLGLGLRSIILSSNKAFKPSCAPGIEIACVPESVRSASRAPGPLADWVGAVVESERPSVFVVDTFPRGIRDELGLVGSLGNLRTVLVLRHVRPEILLTTELRRAVEASYDGIVFCEESPVLRFFSTLADVVPHVFTAPVLVRDAAELPSRRQACRLVGADPGALTVFTVPGGSAGESRMLRAEYEALRSGLAQRSGCVIVPCGSGGFGHWPLMDLLPAAALVVGPPGYNLFYECRALKKPAIWLPLRKGADDQFQRARSCVMASNREELINLVQHSLDALDPLSDYSVPTYPDGAEASAGFILRTAERV